MQAGEKFEVELILNELSIHGQFENLTDFQRAIGQVLAMRKMARQYGRELRCHRNAINAQVTPNLTMPKAVQALSIDSRRSLMQWLTRYGPFWEDVRQHGEDDWFELNNEIVTDSAVGEAAYCGFYGITYALVSINPSSWLISPLSVNWQKDSEVKSIDVLNFWEANALKEFLVATPMPFRSWEDLDTAARSRFPDLTFSPDSFDPLRGHPFSKSVSNRLFQLLNVLHELKNCFNEHGERTSVGHEIYQKHFMGDKAWFSDSSEREKTAFVNELTFRHPGNYQESLFCTWHGKEKSYQFRIHFSWPIRSDKPLYVVYIGPKITKR